MSAIAMGLPYYGPALWACPLCHLDNQFCVCTEIEEPVKKSAKQQRREEMLELVAVVRKRLASRWTEAEIANALDRLAKLIEGETEGARR